MSWIQKLQETYDRCAGQPRFAPVPEEQTRSLMPVDHAEQQVHIEITLNWSGKFRRAEVIPKVTTFIPSTEAEEGAEGEGEVEGVGRPDLGACTARIGGQARIHCTQCGNFNSSERSRSYGCWRVYARRAKIGCK